MPNYPARVVFTGNPSVAPATAGIAPRARLEPLVKALRGEEWAYLLMARPMSKVELHTRLTELDRQSAAQLASSHRRGAPEAHRPDFERRANLLRAAREKCDVGGRTGMFTTQALLFASGTGAADVGAHALMGAMAGPDSLPLAMTAHASLGSTGEDIPTTQLMAAEVAALTRPLSSEEPGFEVRRHVEFGGAAPQPRQPERVGLGLLMRAGEQSRDWVEVGRDEFTRHVLIAGTTGSGKTQTTQRLLRGLWEEHGVPWLVLEPSLKAEYRSLLHSPCGPDLRVFTLGDELTLPLRFNPLAVPPGCRVQSHLDSMSALFMAAFAWVAPMPVVLQRALHLLYADFGFDLAGVAAHGAGQPLLSDLIVTVEHTVEHLGYSREISDNIRAGIVTRLESLTLGSKGAMLNSTPAPLDMADLLARPTILEMQAIADDADKAFLLGAVLLRLAQHRQLEGLGAGRVRHVTVIEEAHRLLAAPPAARREGAGDSQGQAVQSFCNLLCEIRAFGEGLVVVEQSPSRLAAEVMRNTNLKIAHRLVAGEEAEAIGRAMGLTAAQQRKLGELLPGEAIMSLGGHPEPLLVTMPHAPQRNAIPCDAEVRQRAGRPATSRTTATAASACSTTCPESCPHQPRILRALLRRDRSQEFARSNAGGPAALRAFGERLAREAWMPSAPPRGAFRCVLLGLAKAAGFAPHVRAELRRKLAQLPA